MERARAERLPQQLRQTIRARHLVAPGDRVIVAVSGGPDSVALLVALREAATRLRIRVDAAHFHHRLRGADADADADFVRDLSAELDVPFHFAAADAAPTGPGLEAAARRLRYAYLAELAGRLGAARVATGHTLDDQAETVLMRLLRGAGAGGLAAIRFRRGRIVRPLLECPRAAVLDYLEARGQAYRDDASNRDLRFLRNRVRHDVLPVLAAVNPRIRGSLARTATVVQDESRLLDRLAQRALAGDGMVVAGGLSVVGLRRLPEALQARVVRAWLATHGVLQPSYERLQTVLAIARTSAPRATAVAADRRVERAGDRLVVTAGR